MGRILTKPFRSLSLKAPGDEAVLARFTFESVAEIGVGERNHGFCAIWNGFAFQVGHAELGHDVHHVGAWRRYDTAGRQIEGDPALADAVSFIGRGQADEGLAALRRIGCAHELQLAARAADMAVAGTFGGAGVQGLGRTGNAAGLVEIDDPLSQHFRVHPEIAYATIEQQGTYRIRHGADTDLDAGTILNLRGNLPRDDSIGVAGWSARQLWRWPVIALDDVIDFTDMNAVLFAIEIRQTVAHFNDEDLGARGEGSVPNVCGAEVEKAVVIDRTGFEHDDVGRLDEATIVIGNLAKIARNIMAKSGVSLLTVVAAEVPAEPGEVLALGIGL